MSSTEEEESYTSPNVNIVNEKDGSRIKEEQSVIDPKTFSKKCNISVSNEDNSLGDDTINDTNTESGHKFDLEIKKSRKHSTRTSIYDKFVHPCVPKINCPEKIVRTTFVLNILVVLVLY